MSYKALYRTYRPINFNQVVGQKHIVKTFRNALKTDRVSHAYLFSGPRGTGKTSIAKIIAKIVNCSNYPISDPCGKCDSCLSISNGYYNDIIEIDAASNNGIDEIREIRENVKFTPSQGRYKVYIIDEVHMLSIGAFNALLKTLEEPPKHVIFILATTEPHKIPATIHSRCQRFDFKGISATDIKLKLKEIIEKENVQASLEAIDQIAETADGGMRDALSLLDQTLSYGSGKITEDDVNQISGTVSTTKIINLFANILKSEIVLSFKIIEDLIEDGKEVSRIVNQMIIFLKDVLIFKNAKSTFFEKPIFSNSDFTELSNELTNELIFFYVDCLNESNINMKTTTKPRIYLELVIIKMGDPVQKINNELVKRIEVLEKEIVNLKITPNYQIPKTIVEPIAKSISAKATVEKQEKIIDFIGVTEHSPPDSKSTIKKEFSKNVFADNVPSVNSINLYEIQRISDVLTYAINNKQDAINNLKTITNKWHRLTVVADVNIFSLIKEFCEGEVVAVSTTMILVTLDHVDSVNRVMRVENSIKIKELLYTIYQIDYSYIALPKELWLTKRKEYLDQLSIGIQSPRLTELKFKGLELYGKRIEKSKIVKDAINIFGENMVKID